MGRDAVKVKCTGDAFIKSRPCLAVLIKVLDPRQLLNSARIDEMMLFIVVFMGSPAYVKSNHLRSKMSEVLHVWLPQVGV